MPMKRKDMTVQSNRIDALLDEIDEKIGLNANLTLTFGVQTNEGRQIRAEWQRCDADQMKHEGVPSAQRTVHGYWLEETLRKVLHYEEQVDDGWKAEAVPQEPTSP